MKFSRDKYAVLQGRWLEYVREVLGSKEVRKIVEDSGKDGDIARSIVSCYVESLWNVNLQYVIGVQGKGKAKCQRLDLFKVECSFAAAIFNPRQITFSVLIRKR